MCVRSSEECDCRCHEDDDVRHLVPCCRTCSWCKKRIENLAFTDHAAACREARKAQVAETARRAAMEPEEAWEAYCERNGFDPH